MPKQNASRKWIYLPLVFSSVTLLASQVTADGIAHNPDKNYPEVKQVGSANYEYVGGRTQVGGYITDGGDVSADINHIFRETDKSSTSVGLWAGFDLDDGDDEKGGIQINHNWLSHDKNGKVRHVNKVFAAYDRNENDHEKATVGYGQEYEDLFWEGHVSKGLSGKKETGLVSKNGKKVYERAYDYGVGGSVGKFLKDSHTRVRAGLDHEWGDQVGAGEDDATNTTLSAGIEKFFKGTPHSVSLDVAASRKDGGTELAGFDDTDLSASLGYHYDFGGADVYQSDRTYRRVRVEIPGKATPPRYEKRPINKRVPTYKSVPVYDKRTVKKPYQQLVKTTMELEGETFFQLNSAELIPSAQRRLKQIASEIRRNGYKGSIRITGNTCGLGDPVYDQQLSEQRANVVKDFLSKQGISGSDMVARGLGKTHPKYPNTPSQDFKNRRVDIEFVTEYRSYKTAYKLEQQKVQTGTRKVVSGFRNVPAGHKNVMVDSGKPGAPRVIWKTEAIDNSPAWIKRALRNNIKHNRNVNTYLTTQSDGTGAGSGNNAPSAVNDAARTACGKPVSIDVLGNDSDSDATDRLTVVGFEQGKAGIVTQDKNGSLVYTPGAAACGTSDAFKYTISDGNGGTASATVTVTVDASASENVAPVAVDDTAIAACKPVTISVLDNDTDADRDPLSLIGIGKTTLGTAVLSGNTIIYTPAENCAKGIDTFSYTISDGNDHTATANVSVTVGKGDGCNTSNCEVFTTAESDTATTEMDKPVLINVLANDTGKGVFISALDSPGAGTTEIVGDQIRYTPIAGYTGTDSFWYEITDATGYKTAAQVTVTITGESNGGGEPEPGVTVAKEDVVSLEMDSSLSIDVLANDSGKGLKITAYDASSHGKTELVGDKIKYTPFKGYTGADEFWYEITDSSGYKTAAPVKITVTGDGSGGSEPEPEFTVAKADSVITPKNTSVTIDVTANDTGSGLKITAYDASSHGKTELVGDKIKYTPSSDYVGADEFWYEITDSTGYKTSAPVQISVTDETSGVDPESVSAGDDSASTTQGKGIVIDVLDNDSAGVAVTSVIQPANGFVEVINNRLSYLPDASFVGTDTFKYNVSNSKGQSAQASVSVTVKAASAKNRPPKANEDAPTTSKNDAISVDVLANDSDPDGDALTITDVTQPQHGSAIISNNRIVYTPNGTVGSMAMTYTISDGNGNTDQTVLTIAVLDPNDGNEYWPVVVDDNVTVKKNGTLLIDVLSNDSDLDGDSLVLDQVDSGGNGLTSKENGKIRYTPLPGFSGQDTFYYGVHDGHGHNGSGKVTVTVTE